MNFLIYSACNLKINKAQLTVTEQDFFFFSSFKKEKPGMSNGMLPHHLDFNHISIWERARRKHFERGVPFGNKIEIARSNRVLSLSFIGLMPKPSVLFRALVLITKCLSSSACDIAPSTLRLQCFLFFKQLNTRECVKIWIYKVYKRHCLTHVLYTFSHSSCALIHLVHPPATLLIPDQMAM